MDRSHHNKGKDAARYYQRGIRVCKRWTSFVNFLADMGERPQGKTIDRIDNSKGYSPGNCRWATPSEQALNSSGRVWMITAFGRTQHLKAWERETGMSRQAIRHRLRAGWPAEMALSLRIDHANRPLLPTGSADRPR